MAGQAAEATPSTEPLPQMSDKWWIPLTLAFVIFFSTLVLALTPVFPGYSFVFTSSLVLSFLFVPIGLIALYFDRQYVTELSSWTPSVMYFFMFFLPPPLAHIAFGIYLYKRHSHLKTK